jgi:hypothetical protein
MRIAAQVFLAYGLILLFGCLWQLLPLGRAAPDVVALSAVYLGFTARSRVAPPTLGAVIIGYLGDLLTGTPRGMLALIAGILCILGHVIHRRLIVRGFAVTLAVAFFTGLMAGFLGLFVRAYAGLIYQAGAGAGAGMELGVLLYGAVLTGASGPLVFRLCRSIDARFARTFREREGTLEGLSP